MTVRIIHADVFDGLAQIGDDSVHCCVTSPPYWGLRDYGYEGQIGLEPTLAEHIDKLVNVFRGVRRVLRDDATLWLNYGDGYCQTDKWGGGKNGNSGKQTVSDDGSVPSWAIRGKKPPQPGLKPKDLLMMPERLAIALQDDGWWVRSRIIWHKPNPMPESVTDRPTKSHEHVWLMSKAPRYYYDADAIREPAEFREPNSPQSIKSPHGQGFTRRAGKNESDHRGKAGFNGRWDAAKANGCAPMSRNARDVWTIATEPYTEGHFATMPTELARRCILAGCPAGGTVLDPFGGAGTTGLVADRLQRNAILIEASFAYVNEHIRPRIADDRGPLLAMMETES